MIDYKNHSVASNNRIISMDIMRGFAIFGIFLVNMLSFHAPFLYIDPFKWWDNPTDHSIYILIDVFAQASFYPLFSLLFGYGIVILRERTLERGYSFIKVGLRRLSLLLFIGMLHATFIWHGDILFNYALLGLIFLLFLKLSGKTMMIVGALLYVIPNLLLAALLVVTVLFVPGGELDITNQSEAIQSVETYQQGSFIEVTERRLTDWYTVNHLGNSIFMLFTILPLFLLGGGAAKLRWLQRVSENKKLFKRLVLSMLIIGVLIKLSPYILNRNLALDYIQDIFGGPLLAISYALGIALLAESVKWSKNLAFFATVGKLSLSNYLFQSILSTFIFYSYGLGMYGKISILAGTALVIGIFGIQVLLSHYWLKYYQYGPFEWIWRSVTYWKVQKWK